MDTAIGIAVSKRYIYVFGRHSNCSWGPFIARFKKREIRTVFDHGAAASKESEEWMAPTDSPRQISLFTCSNSALTLGGALASADQKNAKSESFSIIAARPVERAKNGRRQW